MSNKYPIFPEVNVQRATVNDELMSETITVVQCSSLVRVFSNGKWYDLYQDDKYFIPEGKSNNIEEVVEHFKMNFMQQCVNHLTLWEGVGGLTERYLSPRQEHHDPIIAEVFKKKQKQEDE